MQRIIRPHRYALNKMWPIAAVVCLRVCLSVCLSVCHDREPCKKAEPIGVLTRGPYESRNIN